MLNDFVNNLVLNSPNQPLKLLLITIKKYQVEFSNLKNEYSTFVLANESKLDSFFLNSIIQILIYFNPRRIKFSITDSNSIYFRIYKNNFEINLEVFYTKDNADDNIEAVYSIYCDSRLIFQESSTLELSFQKILSIMKDNNLHQSFVSSNNLFSPTSDTHSNLQLALATSTY